LAFGGDRGAYDAARNATNGYEHGYLDLNDVQRQAVEATPVVFSHVRRSIADVLGLTGEYRDWLMGQAPLDVASTRRIIRGKLLGEVADPTRLAAPGQAYPILRWRTRLSKFVRDGDDFNASFTERMTVTVAEEIGFQGQAIEARGRQGSGPQVSVQTVAPSTTIDPANLSVDEIVEYLQRASRAVSSGLDAVGISSPESLGLFGLLSHCTAMLESVTLLIRNRRAVEALIVAARIFEQATVLRWLADHPDELDGWFKQWRVASADDFLRLVEYGLETGRQPPRQEQVQELQQRAGSFPDHASWPVDEAWLRDRAVEQGRQRLWWLWRLDRHMQWHEAVLEARFTEAPTPGFRTHGDDLDDFAEVAAFAVEAATTARNAVGSILGLTEPSLLGIVVTETERLLTAIPRPS
jgi:hypothetical protein